MPQPTGLAWLAHSDRSLWMRLEFWASTNSVGSIEVGKDADIALFDGDPFEYTSHVIGVIINGKIVSTKEN